MNLPFKNVRIRLVVTMFMVMILVMLLVVRVGFLQIVNGDKLKKQALEQWALDTVIKPERGIIYDRKGKRLSVSISGYKIECLPPDVERPEEAAAKISEILELDKDSVLEMISSDQKYVKIKDWVEKETGDKLNSENIKGIKVVPNTKRYYPYGNLASFVLGFNDIDNIGLYGIESSFNEYLTGVPGRLTINTDIWGRQLPYDSERRIEAEPGSDLVLTIDETIQSFAEKEAYNALEEYNAKRVTILVMEPSTGDVLAMASMPDYDPNEPRVPQDEETKKEWESLSQDELVNAWNNLWKPHPITDLYEPGSTFKIITAAAALEENLVGLDSHFYCDGYVRDIPGGTLKCWSYENPHGDQSFLEGLQNSCNPVFIEVAQKIGNENMLKYIEAFGFGEKTNINFLGEASGLMPRDPQTMKEIKLATLSYGQGISVTPIQLITAISAIANDGNLMRPRIVKSVLDEDETISQEFKPEMVKKVVSKETSDVLLYMLETVVNEGTGKKAFVPGYRVGGKTGTSEKAVDGKYSDDKYIASFVGIAPINNPKITVLVIVDEPNNEKDIYGGKVAAPIAGNVIEKTLKYLDIEPQFD